jgi:hypothetical protein
VNAGPDACCDLRQHIALFPLQQQAAESVEANASDANG